MKNRVKSRKNRLNHFHCISFCDFSDWSLISNTDQALNQLTQSPTWDLRLNPSFFQSVRSWPPSPSYPGRDLAQAQRFNLKYWTQFNCYCTHYNCVCLWNIPCFTGRHTFRAVALRLNKISNIEILSLSTISTWVALWKPGLGVILETLV